MDDRAKKLFELRHDLLAFMDDPAWADDSRITKETKALVASRVAEIDRELLERKVCKECGTYADILVHPHCEECGDHHDRSRIGCEALSELRDAESREWDASP